MRFPIADRRPGESFEQQRERDCSIPRASRLRGATCRGKAVPLRLDSIDRSLKPLETVSLVKFDFRDHFQLAGAGWYRIVVTLATDQKRPDDQLRGEIVFFVDRKPVKEQMRMNRNINRVPRVRCRAPTAGDPGMRGGPERRAGRKRTGTAAIPGRLAPRWAATVGAVDPAQDRGSPAASSPLRGPCLPKVWQTRGAASIARSRSATLKRMKGQPHGTAGCFPPTRPASERFAIGWDGLVYPLLAVGPAADLGADVAEAAKGDQNACSASVCFFVWAKPAWRNSTFDQVAAKPDRDELCDPYLLLAQEWTASLFSRAARAHRRGDDRMAHSHCPCAGIGLGGRGGRGQTELDLPHERADPNANPHSAEIPLYLKDLALDSIDPCRPGAPRGGTQGKKDAPVHLDDLQDDRRPQGVLEAG